MLAPVTFDYAVRLSWQAQAGAAFVFAMLPARTHQQQLAMERLRVSGAAAQSAFTEASTATRWLHLAARGGELTVELDAQLRLLQVETGERRLQRAAAGGAALAAPESLRFLLPSRYCPSDRLGPMAEREFAGIESPLARGRAVEDWVRRHVACVDAPADGRDAPAPSATEVLRRRAGTPRDLAHLTIALCRAARLPARYVSGASLGDAPADDLHPWVEVLVDGAWLASDPSRRMPRTALVRVGTGRDAADVPLAMVHGTALRTDACVTLVARGTDAQTLERRNREADAICAATLGSLGEATRWHQEARLAASRPACVDAGVSRTGAARARRGAEVLMFPAPPAVRDAAAGSRHEPV